MKLLIFHGTIRKAQRTRAVTDLVYELIKKRKEIEVEIIDPGKLNLPFDDEGETAAPSGLKKKVSQADGYIIVAPEYNHSFPGSLKYVLDMNLKEYIHKPVAMVGVGGLSGGTRMIESLVGVVRELGLVATFSDVNVTNAKMEIIDGKLVEPEKWKRRIEAMLDELLWMVETLKYGRENIPSQYH